MRPRLAGEHGARDLGVSLGDAAGELFESDPFDAEVLRVIVLREKSPPRPRPRCLGRDAHLVDSIGAGDDQCPFAAERAKRTGDQLEHRRVRYADQLAVGAGRVGQRPEEVEHGAHAQRLADRHDVACGGVMGRGEHEAEADIVDAARDRLGLQVDAGPERLEQVGGPRLAGGRAVPVLGDAAARGGSDEGGRGRDVEGRAPPPVPAVSSRSPSTFTRVAMARMVRARPVTSSTVSPFVRSAIRNAAIWTSLTPPLHYLGEHVLRLRRRQVTAGRDRVDRLADRQAGTRRARKLSRIRLPDGVRMDSGWNWTPSAGSVRWRMPITVPPEWALSSKSSGSSGSTTRE